MWCSSVQLLDADQRVEEIARMLGGVKITETTRKHAAEMLGVKRWNSVIDGHDRPRVWRSRARAPTVTVLVRFGQSVLMQSA